MKKKFNDDSAFMGPTHALSGVAVFLLSIAFFFKYVEKLIGNSNYYVLIASFILLVASALLPDLDNVKSTAISTLGIIGELLSSIMRSTARVIYELTRSKYDKPGADPHRGFWHTIVAAISVGGLAFLSIKTTNLIKFSMFGHSISIGILIIGIIILIAIQLIFAVFFKKWITKLPGGKLTGWIIGALISFYLIINIPTDGKFLWVWVSITTGWIVHILGDTLTTSGTPLAFPIPHKGHRWWSYRCPPRIKANGPIEHYIFIPFFILLIIIAIIKILIN